MGDVINYAERAAKVRAAIAKYQPPLVRLDTMQEALKWGKGWERHAQRLELQVARLELLLMCEQIHERASELLREFAEVELARLKSQ